MNDFKLKLILSILSGIIFAFVFIILAFALPVEKKEKTVIIKSKSRVGKISESMRK